MRIVVIGAGPAGEAAAKRARALGAEVVVVEREHLGGLCLNRGCIPSKTLLSAAKKFSDYRAFFEPNATALTPDQRQAIWQNLRSEKNRVIEKLQLGIRQTLTQAKVEIKSGRARFISPREIVIENSIGQEKIGFDRAILATGASVFYPPALAPYMAELLDSDRIFDLAQLPDSFVIVGGGAIGCELACFLNALGVAVTIIEKTPSLLPGEDAQIVAALARIFTARGIQVKTATEIASLEKISQGWNLNLSTGEKLSAPHVLVCVGRRPDYSSLHLEAAGVRLNNGRLELSSELATAQPHIFAAGDATTLAWFAHTASRMGEIAAENAVGHNPPLQFSGEFIPRCLYTWPEVASVGIWRHEAEARGTAVTAQRFFFAALGKAQAQNETEGFLQILFDKNSEKILGAQIIGAHATELIHVAAVALQMQATKTQLKSVMFAHPTLSEAFHLALER